MRTRFLAVMMGALCLFMSVSTGSAQAETSNDDLDIILLVDESRSLSNRDVAAERKAVAQIVGLPILFDRNIRVGVLPFSSGPRSPRKIDGCSLVPLTADTTVGLTECAGQIVRQTASSSSNTDFAGAINAATYIFGTGDSAERSHALILLTDGQYDPDGDERISAAEQTSLDGALAKARDSKVAIWALGFGKAKLAALKGYSAAGAQAGSTCRSAPAASIASATEDLADQMTLLVASVTCSAIPVRQSTPSTFQVSPLLDRLAVSVLTTSGKNPVLTDAQGNEQCADDWKKQESSYNCLLSLDGANAGEWLLRTDEPGSVLWQTTGSLVGSLKECDGDPVLSIARVDRNPIDWTATATWPVLKGYLVDEQGATLSEFDTSVDRSEIPVDMPPVQTGKAARLEFVLPRDSADSLALSLPRVSCNLQPAVTSTTDSVPATVDSGESADGKDKEPQSDQSDQDSPSAWPWVALAALLLAAGLAANKWRRGRVFPEGTLVMQESLDKPGVFVELDGEVGGRRRVALARTGGRFLALLQYGEAADITLTRAGEQVQVEFPTGEVSDDGEVIVEKSFVPFGISLKVQGYVIRVDVPQGFDEELDEDDDF